MAEPEQARRESSEATGTCRSVRCSGAAPRRSMVAPVEQHRAQAQQSRDRCDRPAEPSPMVARVSCAHSTRVRSVLAVGRSPSSVRSVPADVDMLDAGETAAQQAAEAVSPEQAALAAGVAQATRGGGLWHIPSPPPPPLPQLAVGECPTKTAFACRDRDRARFSAVEWRFRRDAYDAARAQHRVARRDATDIIFHFKPAKPLLRSNPLTLSLNPQNPQFGEGALSCATHTCHTPPKTPARRQRAPASTRATGGPAGPIACSSGLSLVQGDLHTE